MAQVKVLVGEVDGVELPGPTERLLAAADSYFNPAGTSLTATNVEDAIKQSIFGSYFQSGSSAGASTNNSTTTYLNKLAVTTTPLPVGSYLIFCKWKWSSSSTNRGGTFRVLDNTTPLSVTEVYTNPNDIGVTETLLAKLSVSSAGIKTINFDFKAGITNNSNNTTISVSELEVFIWRVS